MFAHAVEKIGEIAKLTEYVKYSHKLVLIVIEDILATSC
jgi:hypothetical protein